MARVWSEGTVLFFGQRFAKDWPARSWPKNLQCKGSPKKHLGDAWWNPSSYEIIIIMIIIMIMIYTKVPADRIETFSSDFKKK